MNHIKGEEVRAYVAYSPAEDTYIRIALARGDTAEAIAEVLQRSAGGVIKRIEFLGYEVPSAELQSPEKRLEKLKKYRSTVNRRIHELEKQIHEEEPIHEVIY